MKQFFIITLVSVMISTAGCLGGDSSNKDLLCANDGMVIGYDETECACCPGWIIEMSSTETIKVFNMPIEEELWDIVNTTGYPIDVNLEVSRESGSCSDFYHDVFCIEIR